MARIKYPTDFLSRTGLFYNMDKKHTADGASSPLIAFLAQEGIDLAVDKAATDEAVKNDNLFGSTSRKAEDHTEDRNNLFVPSFKHLKQMMQFLKSFYRGNVKELGCWGATVDSERVVYPPDFLHRSKLYKLVYKKHIAMGATSPLLPFLASNQIDFDAEKADVDKACLVHSKMEQAKRNSEDYREARDNFFNPVFSHVRAIGAFLKALYVNNSKELGHWGYTVDDSPPKPYRKKRKVRSGKPNTIKKVVTGTLFHNTGPTTLVFYKGSTVSGEGIAVNAREKASIPKGYTTITVVNQSMDEFGKCSVKFG